MFVVMLSSVCVCDSQQSFGLEIGFIDHINTRVATTIIYSSIADLHTLQITRADSLVFSFCYSLH
jgi:hypothetical protein